jgi:hypothetical protein
VPDRSFVLERCAVLGRAVLTGPQRGHGLRLTRPDRSARRAFVPNTFSLADPVLLRARNSFVARLRRTARPRAAGRRVPTIRPARFTLS